MFERTAEKKCFNSFSSTQHGKLRVFESALEKQYLRRAIVLGEAEIVWRIANLDEAASQWVTGFCLHGKGDARAVHRYGENKRTMESRSFAG